MERTSVSPEGSPERKRKKTQIEENVDPKSAASQINNISPIEVILSDSLIKPIIYERCIIATLRDKQRLSEFIREINKSFPLPTFAHLKRVRNDQVLLFPQTLIELGSGASDRQSDEWTDLVTVQLKGRKFTQQLIDACVSFSVEEVPAVAPLLRSQYSEASTKWPCKFHEDKALEKLFRNEIFSNREILFHRRMMKLCFDLQLVAESECVAMAFDPAQNEIVALGWRPCGDSELINMIPSSHSTMKAIDNVARAHGGGAWKTASEDSAQMQTVLTFARQQFRQFKALHLEPTEELKYGSYLCTGYDFYLTDEPCLMCAMAMVHSRVRRIFFRRDNERNGALGGGNQLKLHGVKELNHHYQVFRVNEEREAQEPEQESRADN